MANPALNLVVLRSADLDRTARFYEALGLSLTREKHGSGPEHLAAVLDAVVFEIYPRGDEGDTLATRVGFRVESISKIMQAVVANGGRVITSPTESPWGLRTVVADPDGHRIELIERSE